MAMCVVVLCSLCFTDQRDRVLVRVFCVLEDLISKLYGCIKLTFQPHSAFSVC